MKEQQEEDGGGSGRGLAMSQWEPTGFLESSGQLPDNGRAFFYLGRGMNEGGSGTQSRSASSHPQDRDLGAGRF